MVTDCQPNVGVMIWVSDPAAAAVEPAAVQVAVTSTEPPGRDGDERGKRPLRAQIEIIADNTVRDLRAGLTDDSDDALTIARDFARDAVDLDDAG